MAESIIVNLKFRKDEVSGMTVGFVTRTKGSWKGCDNSVQKKKIVVPGQQVSCTIVPGMLYRTHIIPMRSGNGFVATSMTPVTFEAKMETVYDGMAPTLVLTFGNRSIIYDPASLDPKYSSLTDIVDHIKRRLDIEDADEVAQRFNTIGQMVYLSTQEY